MVESELQTAEARKGEASRAVSWLSWIVIAVPFGLLTASLAGLFGSWHWWLDLCSHFRWYYFVAGTVWIVPVWWMRDRIVAKKYVMISLGFVLSVNGVFLAPYYNPMAAAKTVNDNVPARLISLNVKTSNQDKHAVIEFLRERKADWVVLLEIDQKWLNAIGELKDIYPHQWADPRPDNFGIVLLSREPVKQSRVVDAGNNEIPTLIATLKRDRSEFILIATHPPPPVSRICTIERDRQLQAIALEVKASPLPCVIAGDLNATPWSSGLRSLLSESGLRDSALGYGVNGTWNARNWLARIPIDHVLVPRGTVVVRREVGRNVGSDHLPVEIDFVLP